MKILFDTNLFMRDLDKGDLAAAGRDLDSADYYNGYVTDVHRK